MGSTAQDMKALNKGKPRASKKGASKQEFVEGHALTRDRMVWSKATPSTIGELVQALGLRDMGVLFGQTRDGSALVLAIYSDGVKYTEFITARELIDDRLEEIMDAYAPVVERQSTMPL